MLNKITERLSSIILRVSGKERLTQSNIEEAIEEIKNALIDADVNLRVVRRLVGRVSEAALGRKIIQSVSPGQQFVKIVHSKITALLGEGNNELKLKGPDTLSVILMVGLQGAGKTTSSAKLALRLKKQGRKVMLAAADTSRPAAVQQLQILARQAGVAIHTGTQPLKIVKQAIKIASKDHDTVIIDTAGRTQVNQELMAELLNISNTAKPDETLLVADSMTGQNAVDIAVKFNETVNLSGVILNKFDSDTRGGAALSIKSAVGKPIKFIGVGEKIDQMEIFHPERIASRILGMGDVVTLVEKAEETIDLKQAEELRRKMVKLSFTLDDYRQQFANIRKMGSLESIMEMIPGLAASINKSGGESGSKSGGESGGKSGGMNEKSLKQNEAIILSMTLDERKNHRIIGAPRRKRIARGSGTSIAAVNRLLKNFEKSRTMMRKVAKSKSMQRNLMDGIGF